MQGNTDRFTVEAGGGMSVALGGLGVQFKLWEDQSHGLLSVVEHPMDAGRLVPPHVHANEDEYSSVLQGQLGVRIGDFETSVGPGSYIIISASSLVAGCMCMCMCIR
jgi:mannose-6-phosphate isomerase-like protein (cupin superfamily)